VSAPTNHWKLGLFVVASGLLGLGAVVTLGSLSLNNEAVSYTSYFDEAVTGLDLGSTVKFRGVTVGTVSAIDVAPDLRQVEVRYELRVEAINRLGLASGEGENTKLNMPADLRAQLGSTGLSGMKFILIDFFDPKKHPVRKLSFPLPENYIPSEPSTLKSLEDSVVHAVDQFPILAEEMLRVLNQVNVILADIQDQRVPEKAVGTLSHIDETLLLLQAKMKGVDTEGLSDEAKNLMANLNNTSTQAHAALVSVQHASDSMGDVAINARNVGPDLSRALRDVSEAAASLQDLLQALELDPDMLLKGRSVAE